METDECMTCGIDEGVTGGWCEPCWGVVKQQVLDKYLCSECGEALPRKGECSCLTS